MLAVIVSLLMVRSAAVYDAFAGRHQQSEALQANSTGELEHLMKSVRRNRIKRNRAANSSAPAARLWRDEGAAGSRRSEGRRQQGEALQASNAFGRNAVPTNASAPAAGSWRPPGSTEEQQRGCRFVDPRPFVDDPVGFQVPVASANYYCFGFSGDGPGYGLRGGHNMQTLRSFEEFVNKAFDFSRLSPNMDIDTCYCQGFDQNGRPSAEFVYYNSFGFWNPSHDSGRMGGRQARDGAEMCKFDIRMGILRQEQILALKKSDKELRVKDLKFGAPVLKKLMLMGFDWLSVQDWLSQRKTTSPKKGKAKKAAKRQAAKDAEKLIGDLEKKKPTAYGTFFKQRATTQAELTLPGLKDHLANEALLAFPGHSSMALHGVDRSELVTKTRAYVDDLRKATATKVDSSILKLLAQSADPSTKPETVNRTVYKRLMRVLLLDHEDLGTFKCETNPQLLPYPFVNA